MASIKAIKNRKWKAQVYKYGHRVARTFDSKLEASTWASEMEIVLGRKKDVVRGKTLADAFQRFRFEISPKHKGIGGRLTG